MSRRRLTRAVLVLSLAPLWAGCSCQPPGGTDTGPTLVSPVDTAPPVDTSPATHTGDTGVTAKRFVQFDAAGPCALDDGGELTCWWHRNLHVSYPDCRQMETPSGHFIGMRFVGSCGWMILVTDQGEVQHHTIDSVEPPLLLGRYREAIARIGILETGDLETHYHPYPPEGSFSQLNASRGITWAIRSDGVIVYRDIEQPDDKPWMEFSHPDGFVSAAGANYFMCGLTPGGEVLCDGPGIRYYVEEQPMPVPEFPSPPYQQLHTVGAGLCAVTRAGTIECTVRRGDEMVIEVIDDRGPYTDVDVHLSSNGPFWGCGIRQIDGSFACFGYNQSVIDRIEATPTLPP